MSGQNMTVRQLYEKCSALLAQSGNEDAEFDTLCIFQDILADKHPLFRPLEEVPEEAERSILSLTKQRSEGYPLQYLLGEWEFFGYPFKVGEGVLIPRPDTETLVEQALELCRGLKSPDIADLCSGSGCIAITLKKELPAAKVTAWELSEKALFYLKQNAELNSAQIDIISGDVLGCEIPAGAFDLIVSNPPYLTADEMNALQREVRHEPTMALDGGSDGLYFYREITLRWKKAIRPGGWLCFESGDGQHHDIGKILAANGFDNITFRRDLAGIVRTVSAQKMEDN